MEKQLNELIDAIIEDDVFQNYMKQNQRLNDEKLISLLSRHQSLQEDYLKMKQYQSYISLDEIREELRNIKKEMMDHPVIQDYYQSYYRLNELLDEVTHIVFQGISDEILEDKKI